jgi:hypothetical protein
VLLIEGFAADFGEILFRLLDDPLVVGIVFQWSTIFLASHVGLEGLGFEVTTEAFSNQIISLCGTGNRVQRIYHGR